jgi:hypothetical protein
VRKKVHLAFAVVFLVCVLVFHWVDNRSIIDLILKLAGYTYGPLLGLFAFGVLLKSKVQEKWVPLVCIAAPSITWVLADNSQVWFGGFRFGYELLLVNGLMTFFGLLLIRKRAFANQG